MKKLVIIILIVLVVLLKLCFSLEQSKPRVPPIKTYKNAMQDSTDKSIDTLYLDK